MYNMQTLNAYKKKSNFTSILLQLQSFNSRARGNHRAPFGCELDDVTALASAACTYACTRAQPCACPRRRPGPGQTVYVSPTRS